MEKKVATRKDWRERILAALDDAGCRRMWDAISEKFSILVGETRVSARYEVSAYVIRGKVHLLAQDPYGALHLYAPVADDNKWQSLLDYVNGEGREGMSKATPEQIAKRMAEKIFEGRKGHGGGPCSRIVLTREQLADVLEATLEAAITSGCAA